MSLSKAKYGEVRRRKAWQDVSGPSEPWERSTALPPRRAPFAELKRHAEPRTWTGYLPQPRRVPAESEAGQRPGPWAGAPVPNARRMRIAPHGDRGCCNKPWLQPGPWPRPGRGRDRPVTAGHGRHGSHPGRTRVARAAWVGRVTARQVQTSQARQERPGYAVYRTASILRASSCLGMNPTNFWTS